MEVLLPLLPTSTLVSRASPLSSAAPIAFESDRCCGRKWAGLRDYLNPMSRKKRPALDQTFSMPPRGHWVWPLADSQVNVTEPEKPKPYSSVFPNKTSAHSDELCEVTRSAARKGPFYIYPPWLAFDYGFSRMYLLPATSLHRSGEGRHS